MRIYVTETTEFEKSKKSVERFIFGDDCIHNIEQGYLFAAASVLNCRDKIFPYPVTFIESDSDGYIDKVLSVKYTITIK